MNFLNNRKGYELFAYEAHKNFYVDKSLLIDAVYNFAKFNNKFICITRPRRFGKSTAANMLAAFFDPGAAEDSRELFLGLALGKEWANLPHCWAEQGKRNVIHINMIHLMPPSVKSYQDFEGYLHVNLLEDLQTAYPAKNIKAKWPLSQALEKTGDKFIFVIDEWDAVFEMPFMTDVDRKAYILFLKGLLKDRSYVYFAYMTGILPIAKYSSGSPLNMFKECNTFGDSTFYPWFGLTRAEIQAVMQKRGITSPTIEDLAFWYDGYIRSYDGERLFNPTSVSYALAEGSCQSHWTGTGPMNEVRDLIRRNVQDLREDVVRMAGGETLDVELTGFSVEKTEITTKDEILSAMVVYGFLTYHAEKLRIPNHELTLKFRQALASPELGLNQTLAESKKLLQATLERDHKTVAKLLAELHDEKIPFFHYTDENSLACVITVGYLAALDKYRLKREDKAGKGYADFTFEPMHKTETAIILELKYNRSAKTALKCIHERGYLARFKDFDRVLLVGLNYSEATKKHTCLTELVEPKKTERSQP
ncbi:MAG: AAA family ATPase [Selenomonadaceae bacterium]|nr:AAA family ATPase [Selenomonadaceae bacterium]